MKKKTLYSSLAITALLMFSIMPVIAISSGGSVTPDITVEEFPPRVWMCDSRIVYDDNTEPGRISPGCDGNPCFSGMCTSPSYTTEASCNAAAGGVWVGNICTVPTYNEAQCNANPTLVWVDNTLVERINNYAFEGEKIHWTVLVMDKNKIDQNIDVYATIGDVQGEGNEIEVNCERIGCQQDLMPFCNARIDEEIIDTCIADIMDMFECTFTVETPESMFGEFWITVEAQDGDGNMDTMDENEFWFLNPVIALFVDGDMTFDEVRPGTDSYSSTLLVGNDASLDSGVLMDMFISGTDFYDSSSSGARCPTTNQLSLSAFRYFATSGAYSTQNDVGVDVAVSRGDRNTDAEGYTNIGYGIGFNNPDPFYDGFEIIQSYPSAVQDSGVKFANTDPYYPANILAPGAEMAITFKLSLPEPCNGNFDSGSIFFWGEAI